MQSNFLKQFIASLLLIGTAASFTACNRQEKSTANQDRTADSTLQPDAVVQGATILLYEGSLVTTEIRAEMIHKFDQLDSTMGYQLDINIFDSSGAVSSNIVGDSGIIREGNNSLHLFGNVVVLTEDSSKLETDFLRWDPRENKIETEAFVRITKEGDLLTGWGLISDRSLNRIKILKQVSGSINDNP